MAETIRVSVVYALPGRVFLRELELAAGSSVAQAVQASGLHREFPEAQRTEPRYGIFSHRVPADAALRDGDRVEVYRPLQIDPKQARRRRAVGDPD